MELNKVEKVIENVVKGVATSSSMIQSSESLPTELKKPRIKHVANKKSPAKKREESTQDLILKAEKARKLQERAEKAARLAKEAEEAAKAAEEALADLEEVSEESEKLSDEVSSDSGGENPEPQSDEVKESEPITKEQKGTKSGGEENPSQEKLGDKPVDAPKASQVEKQTSTTEGNVVTTHAETRGGEAIDERGINDSVTEEVKDAGREDQQESSSEESQESASKEKDNKALNDEGIDSKSIESDKDKTDQFIIEVRKEKAAGKRKLGETTGEKFKKVRKYDILVTKHGVWFVNRQRVNRWESVLKRKVIPERQPDDGRFASKFMIEHFKKCGLYKSLKRINKFDEQLVREVMVNLPDGFNDVDSIEYGRAVDRGVEVDLSPSRINLFYGIDNSEVVSVSR